MGYMHGHNAFDCDNRHIVTITIKAFLSGKVFDL